MPALGPDARPHPGTGPGGRGKGFDGDRQRAGCLDRNVNRAIPSRSNRTDPWPFDAGAYRDWNRVERLFGNVKPFRRIATRYEKLKVTYLGMLHLTPGFIRLRR